MERCSLPSTARPSGLHIVAARFAAAVLAAFTVLSAVNASAQSAPSAAPVRLLPTIQVPQSPTGAPDLLRRLPLDSRSAISVAAGATTGEGSSGLITGYAIGSGGAISLQRGVVLPRIDDLPGSPFNSAADFIDVGLRPDFLLSADFNSTGLAGLAVASRDGSTLQFLDPDPIAGFKLGRALTLPGRIVSLAAFRSADGHSLVAAGLCASACSLQIYTADGSLFASLPLGAEPAILASARLGHHAADDILVGDSSSLSVIDGDTLASVSPRISALPVSGAVAATTGLFVYDRRNFPQIAVLTADGSVFTLARTGLQSDPPTRPAQSVQRALAVHSPSTTVVEDPTPLSWTVAEVLHSIAPQSGLSRPLILRGHLSGSGMDDLVLIAGDRGDIVTVGHPVVAPLATDAEPFAALRILPARIESVSGAGSAVTSAVTMRVSQDSRTGLVTAASGAQPNVNKLPGVRTYTVNTTADGAPNTTPCTTLAAGCTLRSAIAAANANASINETAGTADTINISPGTYTLTYSSSGASVDSNGNYNYHIEITGPVNIIGTSGSASTIITTANQDKVFSNNSGYAVAQAAYKVYIQGLTFNANTNRNPQSNTLADVYGGVIDSETDGTGYLTIVSSAFTNNSAIWGFGGAIAVTDGILGTAPGPGVLEVDGSTFTGNATSEDGGAIATQTNLNIANVPIYLNGDTFNGNTAKHSLNPSDTFGGGRGAGVFFYIDTASGITSSVVDSTFANNVGANNGSSTVSNGGGLFAGTGLFVLNSQFLNNTAAANGGGLYLTGTTYSSSVSGSTFTGNHAVNGGGAFIFNETASGGQPVIFTYNRIAGNVATRSGLAANPSTDSNAFATITATNNFWGCNGPGSGTGCDVAAPNAGAGTLTLSPYANVTATLTGLLNGITCSNPCSTPTAGATLTLSSFLNTNSSGASLSGNYTAFTGVPGTSTSTSSGYTSTNPGGTASATVTINQNAAVLATATAPLTLSAVGPTTSKTVTASGSGTAVAQVDSGIVTIPFSVTVFAPTISSSFTPSTIEEGSNSTLTFPITNPNTGVPLSGVAFSDTLPGGLVVATPNNLSNTCGGTFTAVAGSTSLSLSSGSIGINASCSISVDVTSTSSGTKTNTTGAVTATNATSPGLTTTTSLTVTVEGTKLVFTSGPPASLTAGGNAGTVQVTLEDAAGLTDTGDSISSVTLTVTGPNSYLQTYTGTLSSGVISFNLSAVPLTTSGAYTYTATSAPNTAAIASETVNAGTATKLVLSGLSTFTAPQQTQTATVTAQDQYSNTAPSFLGTVTLTTTDGTAAVSPGVYTFTPGDAGVHSFSVTLNTAGTYSVTASATGVTSATQPGILVQDAIWLLDISDNVTRITNAGVQTNAITGGGSSSVLGGAAVDHFGNVWVTNQDTSIVRKYTPAGVIVSLPGGPAGIASPTALAIDGINHVWIANAANNSVSVLANNGINVTNASGYQPGTLSSPTGIIVDGSGSVWLTNSSTQVVKIIGAAAPVVTPLGTATTNNTLGTQP